MENVKRLILLIATILTLSVSCTSPDDDDEEEECQYTVNKEAACSQLTDTMLDTWSQCEGAQDLTYNQYIVEILSGYKNACKNTYCLNPTEINDCLNAEWNCTTCGTGIEIPFECQNLMNWYW